MRLGLIVVASVVLATGCAMSADAGLGADTEDFIDMDTPPNNCSAGPTAMPCPNGDSTGNPVGASCFDSTDCQGGTACVAPYANGAIGEFTCTDQCLPLEDQSAWCFDSTACCDASAICRRGLCVPDDGASGTDGSGTAGGTESSGTESSGTAGSGTAGDGSGSDTGAATGTTGMQ